MIWTDFQAGAHLVVHPQIAHSAAADSIASVAMEEAACAASASAAAAVAASAAVADSTEVVEAATAADDVK